MGSDEKQPIKVGDLLGAGVAVEKAMSAGESFLKTLFGPMVTEVGELFADPIREFRARRAKLIAASAQQKLGGAQTQAAVVPPRVLIPLLERGSLESDEGLADKWASLLAATVAHDHEESLSSTFVEILKQLSPTEAKLLDWMLDSYESRRHPLHSAAMIDPVTEYESNSFDIREIAGDLTRSVVMSQLMFDNFVRLGICEDQLDAASFSAARGGRVVLSSLSKQSHDLIRLTPLGVAFLRACRFSAVR